MPSIGSSALTPELQFSPRQIEWAEHIGGMDMIRAVILTGSLALAACEPAKTPEGCPIMISDMGRTLMESCISSYHAEKARLEGRTVTTCRTVGGTTTCVDG
ncbi:MAG TPA: hypothetical protein DHV74_02495 [Sulfitobacter sp.]|nr:hypothetical protein [Sulfitobacter sp.]HCI98507.1 hypothetical protein [Sulfitobacter sp.]